MSIHYSTTEEYANAVPHRFDPIVSFILETSVFSWNQQVCKYFLSQFPKSIVEAVDGL